MHPDALLDEIIAGNERFAAGSPERSRLGAPEDPLVHSPPVAVLGCSDARVPPAAVFGADTGAIFTVRLPGNHVDTAVAAGIGFAVATAGSRLVVVLAHDDCRAVTAGFDELRTGRPPDAALAPLSGAIAARLYGAGGVDSIEQAIDVNARTAAETLLAQCAALRVHLLGGDAQLAVLRYSPGTRRLTVIERSILPR
jgi:carbonic anhydrase